MKYHSGILNHHGYFQRLNRLSDHPNYDQKLSEKVEQFLYRASCVLSSLHNMYDAERQTVMLVRSYINQIKFGLDNKLAVSAEPLFYVYAQIPASLTLLVAMQNETLVILQKIIGIKGEVPSSLNKAMKKGLEKYGYPKEIAKAFDGYWKNGGKYIRNIRDVNEHHLALVDQSYFKYKSDPGQVIVCFPDNPEAKSLSKFRYEREIDAFSTISSALKDLNDLLENVLKDLGIKSEEFKPSLSFGELGNLEAPQNRTIGLIINIQSREATETGERLILDTIELSQIIPEKEGGGNMAVRKMKTDQELEVESKT